MAKVTRRLTSGVSTIMHSLIIPVFVLIFTIYYKPNATYEFLSMESSSFTFNVTMIFCITLVSMSITRGWLYLIGKYRNISVPVYIIWCVGEVLVASLFSALYVTLMSNTQVLYFEAAGASFMKMLATAIYPYCFLWLSLELYQRNNEEALPADDSSLIRFHDEYQKLRLIIAPEAIIFIRSEDNYVQIHYLDQNRPRKFILRSSMKALEDTLSRHGLIRCHRSYFINPSFIKIVHRDSSGLIVAELKQEGYESIPISRKYQDMISRLL